MWMYLFHWCFFMAKIVKNCQKWVHMGMGEIILLETKILAQRA